MLDNEIVAYSYLKKIMQICDEIDFEKYESDLPIDSSHIKNACFLQIEELKNIIGNNQIERWEKLKTAEKKVVNE